MDLDHLHPAPAPLARAPLRPPGRPGRMRTALGRRHLRPQPGQDRPPTRDLHHRHARAPGPLLRPRRSPGRPRGGVAPRPGAGRRGLELRDRALRLPARFVPHHHLHPRRPPPLRDRRRGRPRRRRRPAGPAFFCDHRLYRSHRTGAVVDPAFTRFPFPPQWHFDIVRGLEHFRAAGAARHPRLADAIDVVRRAQRKNGTWSRQRGHPGRTWFQLEEPGPSRWATLRARRVLSWWDDGTEAWTGSDETCGSAPA